MKTVLENLKRIFGRVRTWYWIGGTTVALLVVCGACATMGWYPIALVDGHPIWASAFYEAYQSGYVYWSDLLRTQQGSAVTPHIQNTIRGLAFEGTIDEYLMMRKLERDIGSGTLADKIRSAQNDVAGDLAFQKSLSDLGIENGQGMDYFVRQIAQYNLLDGDVRLENTTAAQWLLDARTQARVIVIMPGYRWNGSGIDVVNASTTP
ncbi:MAG: hypothetical protein WC246_02585 [Candidatus Paceibacterota bacterium]|jgi:hypothetical protein